MMYRKIAFVLLLILLIGCSRTSSRDQQANEHYRVGTEGLRIWYEPGQPPSRVYDDTDFNVVVRVENIGASLAGAGLDRVYISGFDPTIITGISTFGKSIPELEGRSLYNNEGTFDYVSFKGVPTSLYAHNVDKYPFNMLATACYQYQSVMSENICIDLDPFTTTSRQKACIPANVGSGSQGGPIAVTSVEVEPAPGVTRFKIYIANVGNGDVFKPGVEYLNKCSPYDPVGLRFDEIDFVRLNKVELSGVSILPSCKPVDYSDGSMVRLTNGQAKILCEYRGARSAAAYVTPLIVELEYGYRALANTYVEMVSSR